MTKGLNRYHHVALYVKDIEKSSLFYQTAFNMEEYGRWSHGTKNIRMLSLGDGTFLELHTCDEYPVGCGCYWHISFSPHDLDKTYEQAIAAGALPDRPPFDCCIKSVPRPIDVRIAWLYGPDGEHIELFSER